MREAYRNRLETLEEARKLQDTEPHMLSVVFYNEEATVARGNNFECFRRDGESADAFQARAHAEYRAADPRPVQILIFDDDAEEEGDAA